jgi:hypothetical protein
MRAAVSSSSTVNDPAANFGAGDASVTIFVPEPSAMLLCLPALALVRCRRSRA